MVYSSATSGILLLPLAFTNSKQAKYRAVVDGEYASDGAGFDVERPRELG